MVSMAGGLALRKMLPVCHSFACFLSTRANEQIYNNATGRTHVVYVASLAGLLPGWLGHSHQSLRDVSAVGATFERCCAEASMRRSSATDPTLLSEACRACDLLHAEASAR